jgi:hypothetical protein
VVNRVVGSGGVRPPCRPMTQQVVPGSENQTPQQLLLNKMAAQWQEQWVLYNTHVLYGTNLVRNSI